MYNTRTITIQEMKAVLDGTTAINEQHKTPSIPIIGGKKKEINAINGPGKLCREMNIDRILNGHDLTQQSKLYIADDGFEIPRREIQTSPRVNVDYAGEDAKLPWRYYIEQFLITNF